MKTLCKLVAVVLLGSVTHPARAADPTAVERGAAALSLQAVLELAAERAPEVEIGRAALKASRAGGVAGRLLPLGNPYLEITAQRGSQGVTKDVAVDAALWLPLEINGQKGTRAHEASEFVALHDALLAQARATAMARAVRAYGALSVAERRHDVLAELLENARREAEVYSARVAAGDAIVRDAAMVSVEVARHEVQLAEARAELARHRGELERLTGKRVSSVEGSAAIPADFTVRSDDDAALERAPMLQVGRAEARYHASARDRFRREGLTPLSFGLVGGRGDHGETRLGAGLAYTLPTFRSNQVEQARAEAERTRALSTVAVRRDALRAELSIARAELDAVRDALRILAERALPAAERALGAATTTFEAGKGDWLGVLLARRELSTLLLKRLDLTEKGWLILSGLVEITGDLP